MGPHAANVGQALSARKSPILVFFQGRALPSRDSQPDRNPENDQKFSARSSSPRRTSSSDLEN